MIKAICNAGGKMMQQQATKKRGNRQQRNGAAGSKETERQTAKKWAAYGRIRE